MLWDIVPIVAMCPAHNRWNWLQGLLIVMGHQSHGWVFLKVHHACSPLESTGCCFFGWPCNKKGTPKVQPNAKHRTPIPQPNAKHGTLVQRPFYWLLSCQNRFLRRTPTRAEISAKGCRRQVEEMRKCLRTWLQHMCCALAIPASSLFRRT